VTEGRRLESLRRLGFDPSTSEPDLDDLLDLFRRLVGADVAALTVVDATRAWPVAQAGYPPATEVPRSASVAELAFHAGGLVVHEVAALTVELAVHPWLAVDGPMVAVGGMVVRTPDGREVGAVEVGWRSGPPAEVGPLLERLAAQVERRLELRAEAAEYRRFVELAPDAMVVLDLEGAIERCNPAFLELLGVEGGAAFHGRAFLDLVVPEHRDRVTAELARVLFARRRVGTIGLLLERPDGVRLPVEVSAGHLRGPRRSLQLVVRDQTERVRAETERARLTEQLAEAHRFETVGQLAGGLAHDLNNLLAVLVSNLSLAEETLRDLEAGADLETGLQAMASDLVHLRTASDRVDTLTRKLLQFASRDAGRAGERVDPRALVTSLRDLLAHSLGPEVRLVVDLGDEVPEVDLDPGELEQAVTNLVLNARDAMPEGGRVTLTVRGGQALGEEGDPPAPTVVLEVADEGEGMTEDVVARAFEPLFTTKSADRGTGLGLASVRGFVDRIGASVHLETAVGAGTRVTLVLPAAVDAADEPLGESAPLVLLADPAERSRRVIAAMLEQAGYRVAEVATTRRLVDRLEDADVAVLVCDLALPGGSTTSVLATVRQLRPALPTLLLSSNPEPRARVAGAPVLVKPFSSDRLLEKVAAARAVMRAPGPPAAPSGAPRERGGRGA
jgi:PAS domain S-box-containing protein